MADFGIYWAWASADEFEGTKEGLRDAGTDMDS